MSTTRLLRLRRRNLARPFLAAALLVGLSAAALAASGSQQQAPNKPAQAAADATGKLAPYVTLLGPRSKLEQPEFARLTTREQFQELYLRHVGAPGDFFASRQMPVVDFERCMVIAVFQGARMNSDGVVVQEVVEQDGRVLLRFDELTYQTAGPGGGGVNVTPYALIVLPRSDRQIVLQENTQNLKNQPPVWTERARFPALR